VDDTIELSNDRLGRAGANRINAHRLAEHPIGVEAQCSLNSRSPVSAVSLNDNEIPGWLCTNRARLGCVVVEELDQCLRGYKLQRDNANAVSGGRIACPICAAGGGGLRRRYETVTLRITHKRNPTHAQCIFQNKKQVLSRQRAP